MGRRRRLSEPAISFTQTLTCDVNASSIPEARVWATSGQVTHYLDAGTVYVWRRKAG